MTLALVSENRALMFCEVCGVQCWHLALARPAGMPVAESFRPVEHAATCGRTCSNGYTEGHGHKVLAMADLHLPGCGQCAALARDLELVVAPRPLLTGVPPGPREPTPAKSWWPFGAKR
jgi:hypothetical protein